jgi:hypothetical protein
MSKTFKSFTSEKGAKSNKNKKPGKSLTKKKLLKDYYQGTLNDDFERDYK